MPIRVVAYTVSAQDLTIQNAVLALVNETVSVQRLPDLDALGNQQFALRARVNVYASKRASDSLLQPLDQFDWFAQVSQTDMTKDVVGMCYAALKNQFNGVVVV